MSTEEVLTEMKQSWMSNESVAQLFGFTAGSDFDETYSKASIVYLIMYVVAYIVATKETLLSVWKEDVRKVADETHYGTAAWWIKKAKMWQEGDELSVIDGKVDYASTDTSKYVVTAAAINVDGRTLQLKVAKTDARGNLSPLDTDQVEEFQGYVDKIRPLGVAVVATSSPADGCSISGTVRYSAELNAADIKNAVKQALNTFFANLEFNGTLYAGRMAQAIMEINGVLDVNFSQLTLNNETWEDKTVPAAGYVVLSSDNMIYEAIA